MEVSVQTVAGCLTWFFSHKNLPEPLVPDFLHEELEEAISTFCILLSSKPLEMNYYYANSLFSYRHAKPLLLAKSVDTRRHSKTPTFPLRDFQIFMYAFKHVSAVAMIMNTF